MLLITAAGEEIFLDDDAMLSVTRNGELVRVPAWRIQSGDTITVDRTTVGVQRPAYAHPLPRAQ